MLKCAAHRKVTVVLVEHHYLHFVVVFFDKAAQRQTESLVGSYAPVHAIQRPWRLVFVNLFSFDRRLTHLNVCVSACLLLFVFSKYIIANKNVKG